ncbi:hypothetical protein BFP70_16885 [Thioclava sp. SK-1]|uniref:alpha/beta hydrolase fold domain-containing protein n=1 Tax=Thioclava sp. SK-1 TaxID=1889770 RepID=UPI0008243B96|nr:alpha/beta hydrolase fold domain-containing protein [Thioclava sp. SK-1]OCX61119.1 hypothetical protein BFP70_16885 [Thioclava sp. SK-1]
MSLRLHAFNFAMRWGTKRRLARVTDPIGARLEMERGTDSLSVPPFLVALDVDLGGVPSLAVRAGQITRYDAAVLYLHGGGFLAGSPHSYRGMAGEISARTGLEVFVPGYRRAPENPLPAATEDALSAWQALMDRGYDPARIVLMGDSAGGGLALCLLSLLCAAGTAPCASIVFSPWTDLTGSSPSLTLNAKADPMLPANKFSLCLKYVLGDMHPEDPRISAIFAEFSGASPVLIQHSMNEILCDDSLRMGDRLRQYGVDVTVQSWPDTPHVWQLFPKMIPEAIAALDDAAAFIGRHLPRSGMDASASDS